mgnify:CR=1 FL=1
MDVQVPSPREDDGDRRDGTTDRHGCPHARAHTQQQQQHTGMRAWTALAVAVLALAAAAAPPSIQRLGDKVVGMHARWFAFVGGNTA